MIESDYSGSFRVRGSTVGQLPVKQPAFGPQQVQLLPHPLHRLKTSGQSAAYLGRW